MSLPELSVVVPLFDEEPNLGELHERLVAALGGASWELVAVDDGSRDGTARALARLQALDPRVRPVWLARNFGHQAAVTAGLDHARGAAVVVMDGDLQDPPELIPRLLERWREGYEVVYAVRQRRSEPAPLRAAYFLFYRLLRRTAELDIPLDSGDFGLLDRSVVDAMRALPERQRFVRGLRSWVGFRQVGVPYARQPRGGGRAKYTVGRLIGLALDGLVSFSGWPLRLASALGALSLVVALALVVWVFADALLSGEAPRGWASTMVVVLFMGSTQLIGLGLLGEYVRLIFLEAKGRPTYVLRPGPPDPP